MLLSDEATLGEYVTLDELLYLGLKGIIRREDLTEEQHDELEWREAEIEAKKREDEEIEELFHRKKYEIMLEALFNELRDGVDALLDEDRHEELRDEQQRDGRHPLVGGDAQADDEARAGHADELLG